MVGYRSARLQPRIGAPSRLNDGAALLFNHHLDDLRGHHVPGSVIADGHTVRGNVMVAWAADEGKTIALITGDHLSKASVGYEIHAVIEQSTSKDGKSLKENSTAKRLAGSFRVVSARPRRPGRLPASARQRGRPLERAADKPTVYRVVDWEPLENLLVTVPADVTVGIGRMAHDDPATPPAAPDKPASLTLKEHKPIMDTPPKSKSPPSSARPTTLA